MTQSVLNNYIANTNKTYEVGFNSRHYDQYILKGILAGFNPKRINDWIIVKHRAGWEFSPSLLRKFPLYNYDVMQANDGGLKRFEGFMGNNIKESSVPFDIDRKLTASRLPKQSNIVVMMLNKQLKCSWNEKTISKHKWDC